VNWYLALIAAVSGYLVGSIPFALVIVHWFGHGEALRPTELPIPDSTDVLRSDAVSATAVRLQLGTRYGCLTSILDMAKAAAVTLLFKLLYPYAPYFLIASGLAVVGHIWPLYNRFRGGRGQSPIIGSLLVVDWPVAFIGYLLAQGLGLLTRSRAFLGRFGPMLIAAAWLYYRFSSLPHVLYALGLFAVRIFAMRHELSQYARFRREGKLQTLAEEAKFIHLGEGILQGIERLRELPKKFKGHRES
jgi:glycerol-3-phosphate acyltransferase PlsY